MDEVLAPIAVEDAPLNRVTPRQVVPQRFSAEEVQTIRSTVAPNLNDNQLALFLEFCRRSQLSPILRQVYGVISQGRLQIMTGIDGFRLTAQRTGLYQGRVGPYYRGDREEDQWTEVWLRKEPPFACKVGVLIAGRAEPVYQVILYREFYRQTEPWKNMPVHMLAIRAEAHALRAAFPNEMAELTFADDVPEAPLPPAAKVREQPRPALRDANATVAGGASPATTAAPAANGAKALEEARALAFRLYAQLGADPKDERGMREAFGTLLGREVRSLAHLKLEDWTLCAERMQDQIDAQGAPAQPPDLFSGGEEAPTPPDEEDDPRPGYAR